MENKKSTPKPVLCARRKLARKHKHLSRRPTDASKSAFKSAKSNYRATVRSARLDQAVKRDKLLDKILTEDPSSLYSYLKSSRKTRTSKVCKLRVQSKCYEGSAVADGFYDSITSLKSCNQSDLESDIDLKQQFEYYKHILKI